MSLGLLVVVLLEAQISELWDRLSSVDPVYCFLALLLLAIQYPLGVWRWSLVLECLGFKARPGALLRLMWVGNFINQLMPTFLAGDGARLWYAHKSGMPLATAFSGLFWDRVLGFGGLILLGLVMSPRLDAVVDNRVASVGIAAVAGAVVLSVPVVLFIGAVFSAPGSTTFVGRLLSLANDGWRIARHPKAFLGVILAAGATNVVASLTASLLAKATGADLSVIDAVTLVPVALFASLLPISIAGWGVREVTLTYVLGFVGMTSADAVATSVLLGGALMVQALPGMAFMHTGQNTVEAEVPHNSDSSESALKAEPNLLGDFVSK